MRRRYFRWRLPAFSRVLPYIVFVVAAGIGLFAAWLAYEAAERAERARFEVIADDAVKAITLRIGQHLSLLDATRAFFEVQREVPERSRFSDFISRLDTSGAYDGIQGIGYTRWIKVGEEGLAEDVIEQEYDRTVAVWPDTDRLFRTPVILLEPDERNNTALGFDMFSEPLRRTAMQKALSTSDAHATAPVDLIVSAAADRQSGFLVYLPYWQQPLFSTSRTFAGFLFASFRIGDLFGAALADTQRLPVLVEAMDVTDAENHEPLFENRNLGAQGGARNQLSTSRELEVAGRMWRIDVYSAQQFPPNVGRMWAIALALFSLVLAATFALSTHAQIIAVRSAWELQKVSERNLRQNNLMLQEMKHRLKNSVARIQAIVRQTLDHSDSFDGFRETIASRLQAMSKAQDLLTRSEWQRADLKALISAELEQVFGDSDKRLKIEGPDLTVSERAAQSIGLSVHELATNALKYGQMGTEKGRLHVTWELAANGGADIRWCEEPGVEAPPETTGFGTVLIDASIAAELGGRVERQFTPEKTLIDLHIPANAIAPAPEPRPGPRQRRKRG